MNKTIKTILWLICITVLLILLWYIRIVVIYLLISAILSLVARPIVKFFERLKIGKKKIPSSISALATLFFMIALFVGFLMIFSPLIYDQAQIIANINYNDFQENLNEPISDLQDWGVKYGVVSEGTSMKDIVQNEIFPMLKEINVSTFFAKAFGQLGNVFIAFFSISFITFFFLKDRYLLFKMLFSAVPEKSHNKMKNVIRDSKETLTRYFIGLIIQVMLITSLVSFGLWFLGVEHALSIGLFAGFINLVPYIGPMIGAAFAILITMISNLDIEFYSEMMPLGIQILCVFVVIQLVDNFIFQPFIFSNSVNAHPLEIFIVILSSGIIAGIPGMILAVPVYSFIRIIAKAYFSEFRIIRSMTKRLD